MDHDLAGTDVTRECRRQVTLYTFTRLSKPP